MGTLAATLRVRRFDDGSLRWVELTGRFELAPDGTPLKLLGVMADVTDRQTAAEQLQWAVAVKDEFLGLVSHELRKPMTLVVGYARALARRLALAESETREAADALVSEAERLGSLIENMLVLARLDQEPPAMELLDPRPLAQHCVELHRSRFPDREVQVKLGDGVLLAEGREEWIEQVLQNLLTNAGKYSPPGEPIIVSMRQEGDWVTMSVADRGPGLSAEEVAHAFEPFYRTAAARGKPGLGLGLTVCRRLVALQGGEIWAAPRAEGGTEFTFRIPRAASSSGAGT